MLEKQNVAASSADEDKRRSDAEEKERYVSELEHSVITGLRDLARETSRDHALAVVSEALD